MQRFAAEAREQRLGQCFDVIDIDGDGVTTRGDWEDFASYLCSQFQAPIDSPNGVQVRDAVLDWFRGISGRADDGDREVTRSEFTARYSGDVEDELAELILRCIHAVFALCDRNADDRLSQQEFAGLLRAQGVPERTLALTIQHSIANNTGISKKEYAALVFDFFLMAEGPNVSGGAP
jgi:Ca2+-binding EF-hand superfamily protein